MPNLTSTKTVSITKTKLLIATLALAAAGGLAFILVPSTTVEKDGVTASKTALVCEETDGGKILTTKGKTYLKDSSGAIVSSQTDVCNKTMELVEFYCSSSKIASSTLTCPTGTGCADGACIPLSPGALVAPK